MCFSPAASFTAGAALSTVGVLTLTKVRSKREIPFALVPLLFGLQQIIEGFVWLSFGWPSAAHNALMKIYLVFALSVWPIFLPPAILLLETVRKRRNLFAPIIAVGLGVGAFLAYAMLKGPTSVYILNRCLHYDVTAPYDTVLWVLYVAVVVIAGLVSSKRGPRIFGLLLFVSLAATAVLYTHNIISVWCFFSALLSIAVYWYFAKSTDNRLDSKRKIS